MPKSSLQSPIGTYDLHFARQAPCPPCRIAGEWTEPGDGDEVALDPIELSKLTAPSTPMGWSTLGKAAHRACLLASRGFQPINRHEVDKYEWVFQMAYRGLPLAWVEKAFDDELSTVEWLDTTPADVRESVMATLRQVAAEDPFWPDGERPVEDQVILTTYVDVLGRWVEWAAAAVKAEMRLETLCFDEDGEDEFVDGTFYDVEAWREKEYVDVVKYHYGEVFPPLAPLWREVGRMFYDARPRKGQVGWRSTAVPWFQGESW